MHLSGRQSSVLRLLGTGALCFVIVAVSGQAPSVAAWENRSPGSAPHAKIQSGGVIISYLILRQLNSDRVWKPVWRTLGAMLKY